jgi:hypothetical protein
MNPPTQCKHIPDLPVLRFLASLDGLWGTSISDCENSVARGMPSGTPEKLVQAKMRRLLRRGLVDGCPCGCRGDWELTEKGRALLAKQTA